MRPLHRPDTPAQAYAGIAGLFLTALGILALIFAPVDFGALGKVAAQPEFLIWSVSGWTAVFWIVMGCLGLMAMSRLDTARTYAVVAGALFAIVAVWGFIDGDNVVDLLAADTTNNITHAVLAVLGLGAGLLPREAQSPGHGDLHEGRFTRSSAGHTTAGRR